MSGIPFLRTNKDFTASKVLRHLQLDDLLPRNIDMPTLVAEFEQRHYKEEHAFIRVFFETHMPAKVWTDAGLCLLLTERNAVPHGVAPTWQPAPKALAGLLRHWKNGELYGASDRTPYNDIHTWAEYSLRLGKLRGLGLW